MKKQNSLRIRPRTIAALAALLAGSSAALTTARAANGTWTSTTGGDWFAPANWSGGTVADGTDAIATLSATGTQTVNLDEDVTVGSIAFSNGTYTIASTNGSVLTLATSTGTPNISSTGAISATIAGTQGFTMNPGGTRNLTLSGNNIYTGVTTLANGNLYVRSSTALGATGEGNGTVVSQSSGQYPQLHIANNVTLGEDITLRMNWYNIANNGSIVGGNLLFNDSGDNTLNGTLTLDRAAGSNANVVHLMGIQSGAGSLTLNGDIRGSASGGQASGTYADPTRLQFRTTAAQAVINVNGGISDGTLTTGGLSLYTTTDSAGIVRLSGANTYTGSTVHQKGALLVNNTTGSGTGYGSLTVASTAVFGGTGIIAPTGSHGVTFAGGSFVAPGDITNAGAPIAAGDKLTFDLSNTTGGVTFESGAVIRLDISVGGTTLVESLSFLGLTSGADDVVFNDNVVNFSLTGATLADGLYTLASFSADNAYLGQLVLGTGLEGYTASLIHNANSIQLQIGNAIPEPGSFAVLAGAAALAFGAVRRRRR